MTHQQELMEWKDPSVKLPKRLKGTTGWCTMWQMSRRLLVWVRNTQRNRKVWLPAFARYSHKTQTWMIEGFTGDFWEVIAYAKITKPKKN